MGVEKSNNELGGLTPLLTPRPLCLDPFAFDDPFDGGHEEKVDAIGHCGEGWPKQGRPRRLPDSRTDPFV